MVAFVTGKVRYHVRDEITDTAISLITPFLAYLLAEEFHWSGVLAVVVAGLILGHKRHLVQTASSRIFERTNWRTIEFMLENAVFLLIGLQVRQIVMEAADHSALSTARDRAGVRARHPDGDRGPADLGVPGDLPAAADPVHPGQGPLSRAGRSRPRSRGRGCAAWSPWPRRSYCPRTLPSARC